MAIAFLAKARLWCNISFSSLILAISFLKAFTSFNVITSFSSTLISFTSLIQLLIFTSHNLRALEKLNKESIIFTTTNPKNRYIKLANVKSNNNLRDFYLRVISLGGQKEDVYEEANTYEINYAFRKAGRLLDEE